MANGQLQLGIEEAKRFRNSWSNMWAAIDYLATLPNPADLEANIKRLNAQSSQIIANHRQQAEAEAERNMKAAVDAAGIKAKSILEEAEAKRTDIIKKAKAEAAKILADAQKAGEELTKKYAKAHAAAQEAMSR